MIQIINQSSPTQILIYFSPEKIEKLRVFIHLLFPLRPFEVLTNLKHCTHKIFGKVFSQELQDKIGQEIQSHISIQGHNQLSKAFFDGPIFDNKVLVDELDIVVIHGDWKIQVFLQLLFILDGSSKQKNFIFCSKARVSDSLEVDLPLGEKGIVVEVIADSAVPRNIFLFPGYLIKGNELWVEIDLSKNGNEYFEREFQVGLNENSNRRILSPRGHLNPFFIITLLPITSRYLLFIVQDVSIFPLDLRNTQVSDFIH